MKDQSFFNDWMAHRREDGSYYWKIGGIGSVTRNRGITKATEIMLCNTSKFRSQEEQDFAITFITDALSKFIGIASRLRDGEPQEADVIFTDEIKEMLSNGDLIEGVTR